MIDETGKVYNQLTVLKLSNVKNKKGQHMWLCQCSCGKQKSVTGTALRSGHTKSCGCLKKKLYYKKDTSIWARNPLDIIDEDIIY